MDPEEQEEVEQQPEQEVEDLNGPLFDDEPQFDEDGNPVAPADEGVEGEGESAAPEEAPAAYAPVVAEPGEDADDAALRELLGADAYAALNRKFEQRMSRQIQAMSAANIQVATAAAESPELFRTYGGRIQHNLAQLEPSLRAKPEAVNIAIAGVFLEEAKTHGTAKALTRMAGMMGAEKPAAAKPPKAPIPAAQRPPTPSSGARPAAVPSTTAERRMKLLTEEYGLSKAEAEAALRDEGVLR